MLSKRGTTILLLAIAVALSLLSLTQVLYSGQSMENYSGESQQEGGGNLQLGVLPYIDNDMNYSTGGEGS